MARPSKFSQPVADEICRRIADGESLRKMCEGDDMPSAETVRRWLADEKHAEFRGQYACAREAQGDSYAERAVDEALGANDAAIGRLRMDALKWAASKLAPKKYGDKITQEHTGELKIERIERTIVNAPDPNS